MKIPSMILFGLIFSIAYAGDRDDHVRVVNTSREDTGMLIMYENSRSEPVYHMGSAMGGDFNIGEWYDTFNTTIVAFAKGKAMGVTGSVNWTDSAESVEVTLRDEIPISLVVWVLSGDSATMRYLALDAIQTTNEIWEAERMGIRITSVDYRYRADPVYAIPDSLLSIQQSDWNKIHALKSVVGYEYGQINIYYVDNVSNNPRRGSGKSGDSALVILGSLARPALLAHELGHTFRLVHTNHLPEFDSTNVMHSASDKRRYLTEGQIYRVYVDSRSALNAIYHAGRPSTVHAQLPDVVGHGQCPRLSTRIWPDGVLPSSEFNTKK
jgi:hypothetical protein